MTTDPADLPEETTPEPLAEVVSVRVTRAQKRDLVMVAAFRGTDVSKLLWEHSVAAVLTIANQLREAHREVAA